MSSEKLSGDFRKFMDKSFLGSWDLPETGDLILTIDYVAKDEVQNEKGKDKKMALHFKEREYKPMICNKTNAEAISKAYGSRNVDDWMGKKISLYKATISAFGQTTECLRVRDYPPKQDEYYCEVCGELITDQTYEGKKYRAKAIANNAISKFNKAMCFDCYMLAKTEGVGVEE